MKPGKAILLVTLMVAALALYFGGGSEYLTLAKMQSLVGQARNYAGAHVLGAILGFAAIYIAITALSLPGATLLTLFCGAVFGLYVGTLIVSFAASIGATLAMLLSRYVFRKPIRQRFGERLKRLDKGFEREGAFYLFALRLVPTLPFFLINLAMGLTAIRIWTFYWVSQLGMLAGTVAYMNAGRQLSRLTSLSGILNWRVLLAFTALGLLPLIARQILAGWRAHRGSQGLTGGE